MTLIEIVMDIDPATGLMRPVAAYFQTIDAIKKRNALNKNRDRADTKAYVHTIELHT